MSRHSGRCTSGLGLRIVEPCNSSRLQDKGLFIARTLVNVGDSSSVSARILNLSDEPQDLQLNTVVAIAKPVHSVMGINLPGDMMGSSIEPPQTECQCKNLEMDDKELPQQVINLLTRYKHVCS